MSIMLLDSSSIDAVALKLLSMFDYITYEVVGGEEPEIFIRLNDAEKVRRIVMKEVAKYGVLFSISRICDPINQKPVFS